MNKKMLAVAVLSALLGGMLGAGSLYAGSSRVARINYGGGAQVGVSLTGPTTVALTIYRPYRIQSWRKESGSSFIIELKK